MKPMVRGSPESRRDREAPTEREPPHSATKFHFSRELAAEISRIREQVEDEAHRMRQEELARLRELARFD